MTSTQTFSRMNILSLDIAQLLKLQGHPCPATIVTTICKLNGHLETGHFKMRLLNSHFPYYRVTVQCTPGFYNLKENFMDHGPFHFYNAVIYKTIQIQLKKKIVIRLPKFTIVNMAKKCHYFFFEDRFFWFSWQFMAENFACLNKTFKNLLI